MNTDQAYEAFGLLADATADLRDAAREVTSDDADASPIDLIPLREALTRLDALLPLLDLPEGNPE